jgi:hypothetical protein
MSFHRDILQLLISRQDESVRRQIYSVAINPLLDRQTKIDAIAQVVKAGNQPNLCPTHVLQAAVKA